jgi:sirohydrochlorin cobaltochelatase
MSVIILAMHGAPPHDFPTNETVELFNLHTRLEHAGENESLTMRERYDHLDEKMRSCPRNPDNDPFHTRSVDLARHLHEVTRQEVILGFNESCSPRLEEAFEQAVEGNSVKIFVVTPMMTRGGEHSEVDNPAAIERLKTEFPDIPVEYVWPQDSSKVAKFLSDQISYFENK